MIDYTKPITFTASESRGHPKNLKAKQLNDSELYVVTWDENEVYASGRCLFDKDGKWFGDLQKPSGNGGRALKITNLPQEDVLYLRMGIYGDILSLHESPPSGGGIAVVKLSFKDGIMIGAQLNRSNHFEFGEVPLGVNPDTQVNRRATDTRKTRKLS